MAKAKAIHELDTVDDVQAWHDAQNEPLYEELRRIEAKQAQLMAEIVARKREIRDELIAIEQQAGERRVALTAHQAGPDAVIGR